MKEVRVTPIKNGTVIDHIPRGQALNVLHILGISDRHESAVSVAMNVPSGKSGKKDIVKIEDRELKDKELNKIAMIAPEATINIIHNFNVDKKHVVQIPDEFDGVLKCTNSNCISNKKEPVPSRSIVFSRDPLRIKCFYCEREIRDFNKNLI